MKRYSDDEIMAAIRAAWLKDTLSWSLRKYVGGRYQINSDRAHIRCLISAFTSCTPDIPMDVMRRRGKKLQDQGHLIFGHYRQGDVWRFRPLEEEANHLIDLAVKWWRHMGYSEEEMRPQVEGHRRAENEAEILAACGAAAEIGRAMT
ncbi:hypothetical protein [Chitinilyticum aquatile]|uniref:hypothetical protein n=1 Tax=Chitinilyticum aquatile TaxID=362520 RepID=UPI00049077F1|nr:hypothetical protein [Chitinilyticum aquatile]